MLEEVKCKKCHGTGQMPILKSFNLRNGHIDGLRECLNCRGSGAVMKCERISTPPPIPTLFGEIKS
jgi:DnaJ-class molecular chaperone